MSRVLKSVDYEVFGRVQGVCFRMYTEDKARKMGVVGWVKNTRQGTVTGQVQGPEDKVQEMTARVTFDSTLQFSNGETARRCRQPGKGQKQTSSVIKEGLADQRWKPKLTHRPD